jgi:hypothetical protein
VRHTKNADRTAAMTKHEAIGAMRNGEKVTHPNFTGREWMKLTSLWYEFEDGVLCPPGEFWALRDSNSWQEGWSIVS